MSAVGGATSLAQRKLRAGQRLFIGVFGHDVTEETRQLALHGAGRVESPGAIHDGERVEHLVRTVVPHDDLPGALLVDLGRQHGERPPRAPRAGEEGALDFDCCRW